MTQSPSKLESEFEQLVTALEAIDTGDMTTKGRRFQVAQSLDRVNTFLRNMDIDRSVRAPIMHLVNALSDADGGVSNELLRPEAMDLSKGRIAETDMQHKAALSVAVTLLRSDARWTLDRAAKLAAKAIDMDYKALITFRKNVCSRRGSGTSLERYITLLQIARSRDGSPEDRARIIIDGVRSEYTKIVQ